MTHNAYSSRDISVCPRCDSERLEYQGTCAEVCLCDEWKCLECGYEFRVESLQ